MCWVLMSILQTVFNSLAASLLTPTRNFKGALLWIPQSCIKNVNLGDMLTTRPCMLPNSNEDFDHSRQEIKEESTMPRDCRSVHLSIWPASCFFPFQCAAWTLSVCSSLFAESTVPLGNEKLKMKRCWHLLKEIRGDIHKALCSAPLMFTHCGVRKQSPHSMWSEGKERKKKKGPNTATELSWSFWGLWRLLT